MNFSEHVYESVEELIGNTPLVRLRNSLKAVPAGRWLKAKSPSAGAADIKSEVFVKLEMMNPGGSVKDRIAVSIVDAAEKSGALKPGGTIVEATSGNTGAGLAVVAASRGYKAIFVMPDKMSAEKVNALRAFGAQVVISPSGVSPNDPNYYCNVAKRLSQEVPNGFHANQYFNPDNPRAHFESTGPEIWEQMQGKIDVFFAGIGTGGTLSGTAKFLRTKNPNIKVVAIDPHGSIYTGHLKEGKASPLIPYLVEGIGEDMIPGSMDLNAPTECVTVHDDESFSATRMLAQREGLLVGGSCGSAFFGAAQYLRLHEISGGNPLRAVVLLPDSGSRYLSKVFNDPWLEKNNVSSSWGGETMGGKVEYLPNSKKIDGV